jgi:two-component system, OmpR family, phosphate regulon sensor histidine kinase PhoR
VGTAVSNAERKAAPRRRLARSGAAPAVKQRVQLAFLVLLALLLAVLITALLATFNLYRSAEDHYVGFALPLQTGVRDVLYQMEQEESGVRGYVITQDRKSLTPYFHGRSGVTRDLQDLAALTRGHPELVNRLRGVRSQVVALQGFYDRLITFVADSPAGSARARSEVLDAEKLAERFRTTAFRLQTATNRFVQQTQASQRATYRRTLATLIVAGGLALAVALALLLKLPERLRRLYASEEEARMQAEQGANAAHALAHVSDAVFLVDDEGTIRFWNAAGEQLFGISGPSAVGKQATAVVPEYGRLVEAAKRRDRFVPVRIEGDERWLTPALSEFEGGSVITIGDSTAGYVLERTRADFVATASHELRTPLTAVYGGARTLVAHRETLERGQQERLLRMIEQESEHLVQIVDQLLVSAQLDRGGVHLDESEVDVIALCQGIVDSAQMRALGRNTVMLQTPTSMEPLRCDEQLLRQVLVNLVENAVKYSLSGGRVDLIVSEEPSWVRLEVVDEGIGIPPSEQDRIFEKFYRLDAAMSRGVGGSGLGLYISREIVMQMGGTLTVHSSPGSGSTFTVVLPRREDARAAAEGMAAVPASAEDAA